MNSVLLAQMKLQDDLNHILISSYADTLRMFPGYCCANFPIIYAVLCSTPSQIVDPIYVNLCLQYPIYVVRYIQSAYFFSIVTNWKRLTIIILLTNKFYLTKTVEIVWFFSFCRIIYIFDISIVVKFIRVISVCKLKR